MGGHVFLGYHGYGLSMPVCQRNLSLQIQGKQGDFLIYCFYHVWMSPEATCQEQQKHNRSVMFATKLLGLNKR